MKCKEFYKRFNWARSTIKKIVVFDTDNMVQHSYHVKDFESWHIEKWSGHKVSSFTINGEELVIYVNW